MVETKTVLGLTLAYKDVTIGIWRSPLGAAGVTMSYTEVAITGAVVETKTVLGLTLAYADVTMS